MVRTGPNTSSACALTSRSSPAGTISCTNTPSAATARPASRSGEVISSKAAAACSPPQTPARTPPTSVLWIKPGALSFITTGPPIRSDACAAPLASVTNDSRGTAIPAEASSCFDCS
jgi:hypothetical protein